MKLVFGHLFLFCVLAGLLLGCKTENTRFVQLDSSSTGITFRNTITENDSVNIIDFSNVYNGGGVGIGDFNNDGLQDIYFTGNLVPNQLYLNKGKMKFEDVTKEANVSGENKWCRGVSVVDINNDGLMDIYVSATINKNPAMRENILYVNQGLSPSGVPVFKDEAAEYGLNDSSYTTMAAFFDYDNDGDLDVYLAVNQITGLDNPNVFKNLATDGSFRSTGKLLRNDWNAQLKHGVFTDVTKRAHTGTEGYAHSVIITDINNDGWEDIYVTNDYLSNNLLYVNNHDGTFTNRAKEYFKHTSANAMGADIADINNDGLADVVELDMNPRDNFRKKMFLNPNNYQMYQNTEYYGYQYQYIRNTLQLNQGPRLTNADSLGEPVFSEISFLSDVAETDWSWTPLVTDFDNDGYRDIIVTNGFPKDITDHDFGVFRQKAFSLTTKKELLEEIPEVKINNYAFHNNGDLTFSDVSKDWGIHVPSFSNGAAYADLDNDGDMDYVINNINDNAFVYQNKTIEKYKNNNYLNINFAGDSLNKNGLGAVATLFYQGKTQTFENTPYRGYLSSHQMGAHFGLGGVTTIDSVLIKWTGNKVQLLRNVKTNQLLNVKQTEANTNRYVPVEMVATGSLFKDVTSSLNINYLHHDTDYIDFNLQKLLPHKFSEYGPALAVSDIDNNGLEDIAIGGAKNNLCQFLLQQPGGKFIQRSIFNDTSSKRSEDAGILFFDADNDGDDDLYIASGSNEEEHNTSIYQDRFYLNDGKGNFSLQSDALPQNFTSKFCVRAADYDKDGDFDLFVSGRVDPGYYPKPVSSFIFRNDTQNGKVKFTDVTKDVASSLINIGLTCDALFTDFNNDGWQDLILTGEWMPVTFLKNEKGKFIDVTNESDIKNQTGWWNSIAGGDFDNDGDIDYIVGNLGLNSFYKASSLYPVSVYAKDFDNNGSYDAFPALYIPASKDDAEKKLFPVQTRDDAVKQMISLRSKFQNYKLFAAATIDQLFTKEQMTGALKLEAVNFKSSYLRNDGKGKFTLIPLPVQAQVSVLNGMSVDDYDGDGNLDIILNGNDYGTEVFVGRYDALNGLYLKGDGTGNFTPLSISKSCIYIPGNGKALVKLRGENGSYLLAASQNRGAIKVFQSKKQQRIIPLLKDDIAVVLQLKNGKQQRVETYYGSSFLSQSERFVTISDAVNAVTVINTKGISRKIY